MHFYQTSCFLCIFKLNKRISHRSQQLRLHLCCRGSRTARSCCCTRLLRSNSDFSESQSLNVDGENQMRRLVVSFLYHDLLGFFLMPGGWPWDFWTINSMKCFDKVSINLNKVQASLLTARWLLKSQNLRWKSRSETSIFSFFSGLDDFLLLLFLQKPLIFGPFKSPWPKTCNPQDLFNVSTLSGRIPADGISPAMAQKYHLRHIGCESHGFNSYTITSTSSNIGKTGKTDKIGKTQKTWLLLKVVLST